MDHQLPESESLVAGQQSYLVVQRTALQQILALSRDSVASAEGPIQQQYERARTKAERSRDQSLAEVESKFSALFDSVRRRHDEQLANINAVYTSDSESLEKNTRQLRKKITDKAARSLQHAHDALQQETWLSDSVVEATKNDAERRIKAVKKELPGRLEAVDALADNARATAFAFGVDPAAIDANIDVTSDHEPAGSENSFETSYEASEQLLYQLQTLRVPNMLSGAGIVFWPTLIAVAGALIAGGVTWPLMSMEQAIYGAIGGGLAGLVIGVIIMVLLKPVARKQVIQHYEPCAAMIIRARQAASAQADRACENVQKRVEQVVEKRNQEVTQAQSKFKQRQQEIEQERDEALSKAAEAHDWLVKEIEQRRDTSTAQVEKEYETEKRELENRQQSQIEQIRSQSAAKLEAIEREYQTERQALEQQWQGGLSHIQKLLHQTEALDDALNRPVAERRIEQWRPTGEFCPVVRFGAVRIDANQLSDQVRELARISENDGQIELPALLSVPEQASLFLQADRSGRRDALRALQATMLQLLISLPAGRVQFTIIDPVGLGENFAGFMHLADYQESLVGGRIWTDTAHIEQQLTNLTIHMEDVIQKYLRNEFETIDAYNQQAGELAEPYRFLVAADFPTGLNEQALRRLNSILTSGPRCGVFTLILHDLRQELPEGFSEEDFTNHSIHLRWQDDGVVWQDPLYRHLNMVPDQPPAEHTLTQWMQAVGESAQDSTRVEVPFETVTPGTSDIWSRSSTEVINVPVGRSGAVRLQQLMLGKGVAQHALIAGKTGSGKSTLLHVIVTNLAMWYSPAELEFYLIDFKKGVEFKTYATHQLPHARAVAVESDREFGLSVLQRLDAEMDRRGEMYRQFGVQDLAGYRNASGQALPRILLVVDEFQVFFSDDDKLAQDAAMLLDRLVRQGRAFGIHILLGSQTLGGATGLARSTVGQMAVRIALQCSEADAQLILDDDNTAARLLSRPGEAIYNDAGGLVEGNSPFQTAWLDDAQRDRCLDMIRTRSDAEDLPPGSMIVFEGNEPASIDKNSRVAELLDHTDWPEAPAGPTIWLGEPVAIKDPTSVVFRRQSGNHVLWVGQQDEMALAQIAHAAIHLGLQHPPSAAKFVILDGTSPDAPHADMLTQIARGLPHETTLVEYRDVADAFARLADELKQREDHDDQVMPPIFVMIGGLQRYRMLRRQEDDFSFSTDDLDKPPSPDKILADLLREGPAVGIHVLVSADSLASVERAFGRQAMREFDNRVLFQMSAADSSQLIDAPLANRLGPYRALLFSEEQGIFEKFRPYAMPSSQWLERIECSFEKRQG